MRDISFNLMSDVIRSQDKWRSLALALEEGDTVPSCIAILALQIDALLVRIENIEKLGTAK